MIYCPMNFNNFPIDTQSCKFQIGSYSYDNSQMDFISLNIKFNNQNEQQYNDNHFTLWHVKLKRLSAADSILIFEGLGNFSLGGGEFLLRRHVSTYIVGYYLPSGIIIILSWISFIIPMSDSMGKWGRMFFLLLLLIIIVTAIGDISSLPQKSKTLTSYCSKAWLEVVHSKASG